MASLPRIYSTRTKPTLKAGQRVRMGGPAAHRSNATREVWFERFTANAVRGSHMPLDTHAHWEWRNPLNIIPFAILLLLVIAIVAAIV